MHNITKAISAMGLASALMLTGCSSNSELQAQLDSANSRITELEAEISKKDSTIADLNSKVDAMTTTSSEPADTTSTPEPEDNSPEQTGIVEFEGLRIDFNTDKSGKIETIDNAYSEYNGTKTIGIPVTITNLSDETNFLNMFYLKVYGSSGVESDMLNSYFDDGNQIYSKLRPGASVEGYIYFPYDGDGVYYISFDNMIEASIDMPVNIQL